MTGWNDCYLDRFQIMILGLVYYVNVIRVSYCRTHLGGLSELCPNKKSILL